MTSKPSRRSITKTPSRASNRRQHFTVRCQCDTDFNQGEMIECEACAEWQHTYCMGVVNTKDTQNYRCEICEPRLLMVTKSEANRHQKALKAGDFAPKRGSASRITSKSTQRKAWYPLDPESLLNFLAKECDRYNSPVIVKRLFLRYKELTKYQGQVMTLIHKGRALLNSEKHIMAQFAMDTRAKMFFVTSSPVDDEFLMELQSSSSVQVDSGNRITSYRSRTANFQGKPTKLRGKKTWTRTSWSKPIASYSDEEEEMEEEEPEIQVIYSTRNSHRPPMVKPEPTYSIADSYATSTVFNDSASMFGGNSNSVPNLGQNSNFAPNPSPNSNFPPISRGNLSQNSNFAPNHYPPMAPYYPQQAMMMTESLNGINSFMHSLSGLIDSQTNYFKEVVNQRTQASPPAPSPPPPPPQPTQAPSTASSAAPDELTSVRAFLDYLRMYIGRVGSIHLAQINHDILVKSQEVGFENKKISISRLQVALESALALSDTSSESFTFDVTNASDFFKVLHVYAGGLRNEKLKGFCAKLKRKIAATDERQKIHIEKVKLALEAAVGIILLE